MKFSKSVLLWFFDDNRCAFPCYYRSVFTHVHGSAFADRGWDHGNFTGFVPADVGDAAPLDGAVMNDGLFVLQLWDFLGRDGNRPNGTDPAFFVLRALLRCFDDNRPGFVQRACFYGSGGAVFIKIDIQEPDAEIVKTNESDGFIMGPWHGGGMEFGPVPVRPAQLFLGQGLDDFLGGDGRAFFVDGADNRIGLVRGVLGGVVFQDPVDAYARGPDVPGLGVVSDIKADHFVAF